MKLWTKDKRITKEIYYAQKYFDSTDFEKDVLSLLKFQNSNVTPKQIVELFRSETIKNLEVRIIVSFFGRFRGKVLGKFVGGTKAYINSSNLDRSAWSIGATIVHETAHVIDGQFPTARFGHGDNSAKGKRESFPYYIGNCASYWIKRQILRDEVDRLSINIIKQGEIAA